MSVGYGMLAKEKEVNCSPACSGAAEDLSRATSWWSNDTPWATRQNIKKTKSTRTEKKLTYLYKILEVEAFSSCARILGERSTIHSLPALFSFSVEISLRTLIPLFTPGLVQSGSASWDDCDRVFPDKLCVNLFPERVPTQCLDSGIVSPLRLCWVKGVCVFRCNLPPALLGEWPGSITCHSGNPGGGTDTE